MLDTQQLDVSIDEKAKGFVDRNANQLAQIKEAFNLYRKTRSYKFGSFKSYRPSIYATVTAEFYTYQYHDSLDDLSRSLLEKLASETLVLPKMTCCPKYDFDGISDSCLLHHITTPCDELDA